MSNNVILYQPDYIQETPEMYVTNEFDSKEFKFVQKQHFISDELRANNRTIANARKFIKEDFSPALIKAFGSDYMVKCTSLQAVKYQLSHNLNLNILVVVVPKVGEQIAKMIARAMNRTVTVYLFDNRLDEVLKFRGLSATHVYDQVHQWHTWYTFNKYVNWVYVKQVIEDAEEGKVRDTMYFEMLDHLEDLRAEVRTKYGIVEPTTTKVIDGVEHTVPDFDRVIADLAYKNIGRAYELDIDIGRLPAVRAQHFYNGEYTGSSFVAPDAKHIRIAQDLEQYELWIREQWLYLQVYQTLGIEPDLSKFKRCEHCGCWISKCGTDYCPDCDSYNEDYSFLEYRDFQVEIGTHELWNEDEQ